MSEKKTKKVAGNVEVAADTDPLVKARAAAKAKTEEKQAREDGLTWKFVPEKERTDEQNKIKLAPQAKVIVDTLSEFKDGTDRKTLLKTLAEEGKLITRQPVERIVAFYKKRLVESGAIVIE